jgi:ABC-type sugar transport system substrate-binding protein
MRGRRSRGRVTPVSMALVVGVVAGMLGAACVSPAPSGVSGSAPALVTSSPPTASPTTATAPGCVVGVSWNVYSENRHAQWDEPGLEQVIERAGGVLRSADAGASSDQQSSDVDSLVAGGAKVIVIHAQDTSAILPAVQSARILSPQPPTPCGDTLGPRLRSGTAARSSDPRVNPSAPSLV